MSENQTQLILLQDLGKIYSTDTSKDKKIFGLYKCGYCGKEFKANSYAVKIGNTKSCGCYKKAKHLEAITKHGLSCNRIYGSWIAMKHRVLNIKSIAYNYYGGRGINICDRWLKLENFIEDMYPSYKEGLTLDRIDVNGNYEPSNCRWATKEVQSRNTRLLVSTNTSGYRGVSFYKRDKVYTAQIRLDGKKKHIGRFETALEAAKAHDKYVIDNNLGHIINNV